MTPETGLGASLWWLAGSWSFLTLFVWGVLEKVGRLAVPRFRKQAFLLLSGLRFSYQFNQEAKVFVEAFDTVFGKRHWTRRCFALSAAFSVGFTSVIWALVLALNERARPPWDRSDAFALAMLLGLVFINIPGDYLSLLKSRYYIGEMRRASRWEIPILLFTDVSLSLIIGATIYVLVGSIGLFVAGPPPFRPHEDATFSEQARILHWDIQMGLRRVIQQLRDGRPHPYILATLMTSVWALFTSLSGVVIRAGMTLDGTARLMRRYLDIQKHPFSAMGAVSACLITLIYAILATGLVIAHYS